MKKSLEKFASDLAKDLEGTVDYGSIDDETLKF